MVKRAKDLGEDSKVGVRRARKDAMDMLKQSVKDGYPEDLGKKREKEVQDLTDKFSGKIDEMISIKEKDIMTV